jgi:hypothetical protein
MRKWGIVITVFYFLILLVLLLPAWLLLAGSEPNPMSTLLGHMRDVLTHWAAWIPFVVVVSGQALLLFLSVDTSNKRLKPRTHVLVTTIVTAMFLAMLTSAAIYSLIAAVRGDRFALSLASLFIWWGLLWVLWGVVFYLYSRNSSELVTRATSWLLKGSILELIIAVVSHVIVRRRNDCSAPIATSFGIVTGIAIMLLSFGPSVLFLLKHRMDARAPRPRATS